jgi:hypothetical protein
MRRAAIGTSERRAGGVPSTVYWVSIVTPSCSGTFVVVPAETTPGSARTRSSSRDSNASRSSCRGYRSFDRGSSARSIRSARNPGSSRRKDRKLSTSRPHPTSSVAATAISAVTSTPSHFRPDAAVARASRSRMLETRRRSPTAAAAGIAPKSAPVRSDRARQKMAAGPSIRKSASTERNITSEIGFRTLRNGSVQKAARIPAAPPAIASSSPSSIVWRKRRARLAPSARRTEISPCRATPRTSRRLATLAQQIERRSPTAAARTKSDL